MNKTASILKMLKFLRAGRRPVASVASNVPAATSRVSLSDLKRFVRRTHGNERLLGIFPDYEQATAGLRGLPFDAAGKAFSASKVSPIRADVVSAIKSRLLRLANTAPDLTPSGPGRIYDQEAFHKLFNRAERYGAQMQGHNPAQFMNGVISELEPIASNNRNVSIVRDAFRSGFHLAADGVTPQRAPRLSKDQYDRLFQLLMFQG